MCQPVVHCFRFIRRGILAFVHAAGVLLRAGRLDDASLRGLLLAARLGNFRDSVLETYKAEVRT